MVTTVDTSFVNASALTQRTGSELANQKAAAKYAAPASASSASQPTSTSVPDKKSVEIATQQIQDFVQKMAQNLEFTLDPDTEQVIVRVVSASSKEVIRQIPSETMVELAKELDRVQGLLFSDKA